MIIKTKQKGNKQQKIMKEKKLQHSHTCNRTLRVHCIHSCHYDVLWKMLYCENNGLDTE